MVDDRVFIADGPFKINDCSSVGFQAIDHGINTDGAAR